MFESGYIVSVHALAALGALLIGLYQFIMSKGTGRHRLVGYVWAALMVVVAVSSFWIHEIRMVGPFSPIHILAIVTLVGLAAALYAARRGNIKSHRIGMTWLYCAALIGAGAFTLLPGRVMYEVVFGQ